MTWEPWSRLGRLLVAAIVVGMVTLGPVPVGAVPSGDDPYPGPLSPLGLSSTSGGSFETTLWMSYLALEATTL